jgi:hypothetical protein
MSVMTMWMRPNAGIRNALGEVISESGLRRWNLGVTCVAFLIGYLNAFLFYHL